jgi:hypothetical protein
MRAPKRRLPGISARVVSLALLALLLCAAVARQTDRARAALADARLPVPSGIAQAPAEKHFARLFLQKYQRMDSNNALSFAEYLYSRYHNGGKDHPVTRYVALTLCWKLAARAGDPPVLFEPLGALCHGYRVDRARLRADAARATLPNVTNWERLSLLRAAYRWANAAATSHRFPEARDLLTVALTCARHLNNTFYLRRIPRLAQRLVLLQAAHGQAVADRKLLRSSPNNSPALLRMALYHWLVSAKPNTLATGDALAKKSGCATAAEIMQLSAKPTRTTLESIRLGNLWWNLPKTHKLLAYTPLVQRHAVKIYRRAIPGVARAFSAMIGRGDYHAAVLFITQAKKAAKRTRDPKMLSIARRWNSMLRQARMLHRRYTAALKTIAKKAHDPAANQTIGEYLCFLGGQWKSGLAYLKLSSLPGLANAAKTDLADPQAPAAQIALGNKWWVLARGYRGIMKTNIQLRAVHWYALALEKLPAGEDKDLRYRVAKVQAGNP